MVQVSLVSCRSSLNGDPESEISEYQDSLLTDIERDDVPPCFISSAVTFPPEPEGHFFM